MVELFNKIRQIVPFDPSIDTSLGHRNLVLIYVIVWLTQLMYGAYAIRLWIFHRKNDS